MLTYKLTDPLTSSKSHNMKSPNFSTKPNTPLTNHHRKRTRSFSLPHLHPTTIKADLSSPPSPRRKMSFSSNPLSLSVPDSFFESWLRDSGHLEILDHRTSQIHRLNSENHLPTTDSSTGAANSASDVPTTLTAIAYGLITSIVSSITTLVSLLTVNPISKLANEDFSGQTPSWTSGFFGSLDSYSFPSSPAQAKMRVQENVKRFARNYASLFLLFFACTLYQMPLVLAGLISCLAIWDLFKFCSEKWLNARFPVLQQVLVRLMQCASVIILMFSNLQMALFCALAISYAVVMLHASFRKLTPAKQSPPAKGRRR